MTYDDRLASLTKRQAEVFGFIRTQIKGGLPPTVREIGDRLGIRSPNGVECHIRAIIRKGLLTRQPLKSRGFALTEPLPACPHCGKRPDEVAEVSAP